MFYFRLFLIFLWAFICALIGLVVIPFWWGDLNLDRWYSRLNTWVTLKILHVKVLIEGEEHLEAHQPCVYVSNHQSGMDLMVLGPVCPHRTVVIGKRELIWIPFFGLFFVGAGNILINRKSRTHAIAGLQQAVEAIRSKGASIWIFPEGTRNPTATLLPFKKGAFHMAIQTQVPVVPIVVTPYGHILNWRNKKLLPGTVTVRVLSPEFTTGLKTEDAESFSIKVRERMVQAVGELVPRPQDACRRDA